MPMIPHYMRSVPRGYLQNTGHQTNDSLRVGEIKEIIYPTDTKSISRKYIEYTVEVAHREGGGPETSATYSGCIVGNLFGLGGDIFNFTLRPDSKNGPTKTKESVGGIGAKVLLLCVNGSKNRSVIVGGIRDELTGDEGDKDEGHNLKFQFNGLKTTINKDGEFNASYNGPSQANGKVIDGFSADAIGASFQFLKDGTVQINDAKVTQTIKLNRTDKEITVVADQAFKLASPKVYIGSNDAAEALMMGTTYRDKETSLHNTLKSNLTSLATSLTTLGISHTTAGTAITSGSVPLAIPMVGGVAAAPFFATAGATILAMTATITQMATTITQMQMAIAQFEASSSQYISSKNFADHG